jgi:hypothetical protein
MSGFGTCMMRTVTALAVAGGLIGVSAGTAQGYGLGDCNSIFASQNVTKADTFSVDGGKADFGDQLHIGGVPVGTAVICWSIDGRVAVKGRLYADNLCLPLRPCTPVTTQVKISFQRTNGLFTKTTRRSVVSQGMVADREVTKKSPSGSFDRVRIQLFTFEESALATPPPPGNACSHEGVQPLTPEANP